MSLRSHIRRIVAWIERRRRHAEIRRALPKLRELDRQLAVCRRDHKPGAAKLIKAKQEVINAALGRRTG